MDWSKLPDVVAVALLTIAFASVARRNHTPVSRVWLTAWLSIVLHFAAGALEGLPGPAGQLASALSLAALTWAGMLFMWAAVPYRRVTSSLVIEAGLLVVNTAYVALLCLAPAGCWALIPVAALFGLFPLGVTLAAMRTVRRPLRWILTAQFCALSTFLICEHFRPGNHANAELGAVLFTVYMGCCIHFLFAHRQRTAGAFVTTVGFFGWAMVFVVAPLMARYLPNYHLENEVWNLPKYVVAVGMILLLLESQVEHNQYLALHDDLTGLPNRRLFKDRLASSVERARRAKTQTALLVVDLNRFKEVNDTYGHHAGDILLRHVAQVFLSRVRRSDTVARTGGDEFSIILDETASRRDAEAVGADLLERLREPVQIGQHRVQTGASVGVALFPDDASDTEALCIAADLRMYSEKHGIAAGGSRPALEEGLAATPAPAEAG